MAKIIFDKIIFDKMTKRMQRFLQSEISSLLNIIGSDDNYRMISGPLSTKLTHKLKECLWAKIAAEIAEESGQPLRATEKLKKVPIYIIIV